MTDKKYEVIVPAKGELIFWVNASSKIEAMAKVNNLDNSAQEVENIIWRSGKAKSAEIIEDED